MHTIRDRMRPCQPAGGQSIWIYVNTVVVAVVWAGSSPAYLEVYSSIISKRPLDQCSESTYNLKLRSKDGSTNEFRHFEGCVVVVAGWW